MVWAEGSAVKKSHFSIAVKGKGMLLGSFISYGFEAFPNATWYDRSDATNEAIGVEVKLAEKGFTREQDRAMAKRAGKNLANPKPTDVTATFSQVNFNNIVVIEGRRRSRTLNICTADLTMKTFDKAMDDLIDAVKKVL